MSDKISSDIVLNGLSAELLSTTGEPIGTPILKYPFLKDGDTDTKIIERRYWLYANVRSVPQINSALDEATASLFDFETNDMFLCEESEPTDVGCGLVEITRTFANVPKTRNVRMPQSITLFGIKNSGDVVAEDITSQCTITYKYDNNKGQGYTVIFPESAIGKRLKIQVQQRNYPNSVYFIYLTPTMATNWYGIDVLGYTERSEVGGFGTNTYKDCNTPITIGIIETIPTRNSKSVVADGYITYQYVRLSSTTERVSLPLPFEEESGANILTTTTKPTISEYSKMVSAGNVYQCAPATISMWLGNIAEIQIPYVYAM